MTEETDRETDVFVGKVDVGGGGNGVRANIRVSKVPRC